MTHRFTSACSLIAVGSVVLLAQAPPPLAVTAVAQSIERELRAANVPGASFAIAVGRRGITGRFGLADANRGVPMTPTTLMQVGSLNKLITALALSSTLEEQRIPYASPLGKHVEGLSPRLAAVTFHQLLSQSSGLKDVAGGNGTTDESALGTRVRAIGEDDFVLPPGTVFSYSNLGYAAAGFALEQLRKKPFADALSDAALTPLLMRQSTMRVRAGGQRLYAVGHRLEQGTAVAIGEIDTDTSLWPAGYLWTTGDELLGLVRMLATGKTEAVEYRGRKVGLPEPVLTRVTSPHTPMPNVFAGGHYGYGLMLGTDGGTRIFEHGGTQRGFSSILRVAPDHQFGIVILTNLDGAPLRRIAQKVMGEAIGLGALEPSPPTEVPVTPEEMTPWAGVYRNRGTAEIAIRDGRTLLILDGGPPMTVSRIGVDRYLARPKPDIPGPEFVLRPASGTTPAYLHFALWAYAR